MSQYVLQTMVAQKCLEADAGRNSLESLPCNDYVGVSVKVRIICKDVSLRKD